MSPDSTSETNRRTILKGATAAVAGFALGTGTASADAGTDADTQDCGWEYRCDPWECPDGGADTLSRRYCCNGSCSGWEVYGCCRY